jgi:Heterokaryon incompatibility protein (HET)
MFSHSKTGAKQSLRRRFGFFKEKLDEANIFHHTPLDTSTDGIRLLTLEAARDYKASIKCTLQHATIAQKPKYDALSYTWGDETAKRRISINGREFEVGRNLYDALKHIRHTYGDRVLWIDAICIDQAKVPEKNQQIRMMPFTYNKASQVLIWLGSLFESDRESVIQIFGRSTCVQLDGYAIGILTKLCKKAYWTRVWIIQEIGRARRIRIYFGSHNTDWERFISTDKLCQSCHNTIPLKLQQQLDDKYSSGHKLQTLIETHKGNLCKEPRDHVYGFIGLANDCGDRFPIDYDKSLFEVWKDTIMFKAADQDSPQHDILRFGKTVQTLLGGQRIATRDDVQSEILLHMTAADKVWDEQYKLVHCTIHEDIAELMVPARIAGRISYLGPTYSEIISDTRKMVHWKSSITRFIPEDQLSSAREEDDLFVEVLENVVEQDLEAISVYDRTIIWEPKNTPHSLFIREESIAFHTANFENAPVLAEPRLFLLSGTKEIDQSSSGKMGLAPPEAQEGDYICQVQGIAKALIVRKRIGLRIVGTAVMAENTVLGRSRRDSAPLHSKFGTARFDTIHSDDRLDLFLDVATAYELLN